MPYIPQVCRESIDYFGWDAETAGDLNYVITRIVDDYLKDDEGFFTYTHLNEVIGVLECVKLELYRRVAAPYEDRKCAENGDVYR